MSGGVRPRQITRVPLDAKLPDLTFPSILGIKSLAIQSRLMAAPASTEQSVLGTGWGDAGYGPGSGGWQGGGGCSGQASPEAAYPDALDTPCVETTFVGSTVSVDRVNNAALAAANDMATRSQNWEWGAFIYELNGVVQYTPLFTDQRWRDVNFDTSTLPDGAHVLGIIHSHPNDPNVDDRTPSDSDWDVLYQAFAGRTTSRYSIDSNLLMYIYTSEDGRTRPYDNTDRSGSQRTRATCPL